MRCADCLESLNALMDDELAPADAAEVREHLSTCADCRREQAVLAEVSSTFREGLVRHPAPDVLKARLRSLLAQPDPFEPVAARPRWSWMALAAAGVLIAAASSGITFVATRQAAPPAVAADVLSSHLRALMPGHLTDVASTNLHNVKPWFDGRVDFSPSVPNLDADGFPLVGGRLDYVAGRSVAAVVYARRLHMISVYSWPAGAGAEDSAPVVTDQRGYHLVRWRRAGLEYWAVSDLGRDELDAFVRAFNASR